SDNVVCSETQIVNSVVGSFCHIGKKVRVQNNSIIANRCVVRSAAEVPARTRLQPNSVF
ncbi:hypothetical protein HZB08_01310, partial [Candidatus Saganbacteria bacterium]|nr:hypothetical protein [Candidatus Saganbacteria bacterium]